MASSKTKPEQLAYIEDQLKESQNVIVSKYAGLTVNDMQDLRTKLREQGLQFKVVKNNIFRLAWKNTVSENEDVNKMFVGQLGVTFGGEDLPAAAKLLRDYAKKNDNLVVHGGVFEGEVLDDKGVAGIAGLPSKPELLATIARGLNAPATNIALLQKEIIASLARSIQQVGEKNG